MFVRDPVIKTISMVIGCSTTVIKCLGTHHKQPRKIPTFLHLYCRKLHLCSSELINKSWSRHFSSSRDGDKEDGVIDVTKEWGLIEHDSDYEEFAQKVFRMKHMGHNVLVVQPYERKQAKNKSITHPSLRLSEAVALVQSIPNWKVLGAIALSTSSVTSAEVLRSGNIDRVVSIIRKNEKITAVFMSVDILTVAQLVNLQKQFGLPVYDRYTIVIQIFHNHATSKEAKLQVAMAEIPYLQQCLDELPEGLEDRLGDSYALIGGQGRTPMEKRRDMLKLRERRIKNELEKLSSHRQTLRDKRTKLNVPSVAIVGYTNAGKTSLIQVLTREVKIQPKNRLFATLDVSCHRAQLPSGLGLVYVDTVGFMSDLPDSLIQSFKSTLEDAMYADLIVHIWDVSHPDSKLQIHHVSKILQSLRIEKQMLKDMIVVGNKVDKLSEIEQQNLSANFPDVVQISCVTGDGISELEECIEKKLVKSTGRKNITLKVRSGSQEHLWLLDNVTVTRSAADVDENFMLVYTLMTDGEMGKFRRRFIVKHKEKVFFE